MTSERKHEINRLARLFYKMHGYEVPAGYDFSRATHPQERSMFNLAEAALLYFEPRFQTTQRRRLSRPAKG